MVSALGSPLLPFFSIQCLEVDVFIRRVYRFDVSSDDILLGIEVYSIELFIDFIKFDSRNKVVFAVRFVLYKLNK